MREAEVTAIARNLSRKGTTGLPQVIHVQFVEPYRRTLHERPLLGHARNGLVLDGNLCLFGSTARMLVFIVGGACAQSERGKRKGSVTGYFQKILHKV